MHYTLCLCPSFTRISALGPLPLRSRHLVATSSDVGAKLLHTTISLQPKPSVSSSRKGGSRLGKGLLIGLAASIILAGVLAGLVHIFVPSQPSIVRGGIWTDDLVDQPHSLIPNGSSQEVALNIDQALYLPLFYGDAQGVIHAGAASAIPTLQNGGISADATTWTFHLRPHLVWSDGQPYDARDVDYSWRLWLNPAFGADFSLDPIGWGLIRSADISPDNLSITFHLKKPFVPFFQYWTDGEFAPLPAHHFSSMAPSQILKSSENLNPSVTSGPFRMSESQPGSHYTLVQNSRYYQASAGLPYLDKVVFRIVSHDAIPKDLQAGLIDSTDWLDITKVQDYQRLPDYTLVIPSARASFEALYFNFHNAVLASHLQRYSKGLSHKLLCF